MKGEALVRLRNVHVQFGAQPVLRDVSLDIPRGETVVIIGESGCGKTVLMKTIIGLVRATSGSVRYEDHELSQLDDKALTAVRTRMGFVFQQAALFDSMTIAENVAFPLLEHRRSSRESAYRLAAELLADVGLNKSVMTKKPAELSGGMRKRVGLARALVMQPDLMMYDEPTTGLDPIMSDVINELILRSRIRLSERSGSSVPVTSVVVTHDMHSAMKLADRVVMLYPLTRLEPHEKQIIFTGTPEQLEACEDPRVTQFVRGEAGDRLMEMQGA